MILELLTEQLKLTHRVILFSDFPPISRTPLVGIDLDEISSDATSFWVVMMRSRESRMCTFVSTSTNMAPS